MIGYVQKNTKYHLNKEGAKHGLYMQGIHTEEVEFSDIIFSDSKDIYYGNVGFINKVITQLGYEFNEIGHVPEELYHIAGRTIEKVTLADALKRRHDEQIFIKPIPKNHKKFNGLSFDNPYDLYSLAACENDEIVLLSPKINIISEWRGFVLNDELIDSEHYKGNFRISPDYALIERNLKKWSNRPVAWSCDMGITDTGETIVVECNDVMSLGWYGLYPNAIGQLLIARWEEIHRNKFT